MKTLTFITGNFKKAEQLEMHLGLKIKHKKISLEEIQSLDLKKIVEHKAKSAYKEIKSPVLVEDTSLKFASMKNLPGPLIKWFLEDLGNSGLCKLVQHTKNRKALAEVCFGYYDGQGEVKFFQASIAGTVSEKPKGEKGFGWDPIFIPKGKSKTWGQMSAEEQAETSMRRIALQKLKIFLQSK